MVSPLSPEERRDLMLSVGTHRKTRRLSPIQVARLISRWQENVKPTDIAKELGLKGTSMLGRFLGLLSLPVELQPLVSWGNLAGYLSFSVAYEIARCRDPESISFLTRDAIEKQRTKEEVRAIIQCFQRGGGSVPDCIQQIDSLRSEKVHYFLFFGQFPSAKENLLGQESAALLKERLMELFGEENVLSTAVQANRFSFTVRDSVIKESKLSSQLTSEKVENFVVSLLEEK